MVHPAMNITARSVPNQTVSWVVVMGQIFDLRK